MVVRGERLPGEVWVLLAASFIIAVGFGIVAPALPNFAASFHVSNTAAALVVSAFAFVRLAFAPVSGRLVSAFGEPPTYLVGILIVAVGTGACGFATAYWQLLLFRSLAGVGSTMFTVSAVGLLFRLTPPAQRARVSGLWSTSFLLGNIAGPGVGGLLVGVSVRAPFLAYAAALVLADLVVWLFLRRSTLAARVQRAETPAVTVRAAVRLRAYQAALVSGFANGWAVFGVRVALIPLFVTEVLHREPGLAGLSLSVFAIGNTAVLLLSGKLADSWGRRPLALAGLAISAVGTCWLGFTTTELPFLLASLVAGVGAGVLNPAQSAVVADVLGANGRGGPVLATFQMAGDLGTIIGPLVAGAIVDSRSFPAAFAVTGAVAAAALLAWLRAPETLPRAPEPAPTRVPVAGD